MAEAYEALTYYAASIEPYHPYMDSLMAMNETEVADAIVIGTEPCPTPT